MRIPNSARLMRRLSLMVMLAALFTSALTGVVGSPAPRRPPIALRSQSLAATATTGWSAVRDLGINADMVGFTWSGNAAHLEVRAVDGDGTKQWVPVDGEPEEGPDTGSHEAHPGTVSAGPVWLGHDVRNVEVRVVDGAPRDLKLHAVDSRPPADQGTALGSIPAADAVITGSAVIPRSGWGADESYRTYADGCDGKPSYATDTRFAVVHHTVNSNDYGPGDSASLIRGIYYFHTHVNGWCDIGYNFLVDRFGNVFEGRAGGINRPVIGAHAGGFNTYSTGIAVIGDFRTDAVPQAAYDGLRRILAWKMSYHGIDPQGFTTVVPYDSEFSRFPAGQPVVIPNLIGHTDVDSTECPGARLYDLLPSLRNDVAGDIAANRDVRFMGDWNGDGVATPGAFRDGVFYLRNSNTEGPVDTMVRFGDPGDFPVVGDWNGDGIDTVGVYRNGTFYLRNSNTSGIADVTFNYGDPGDFPIAGDWNGDGIDTVGVYRNAVFYLRNSVTTGVADASFPYGNPGDFPVVGDWNADGVDTPAVYRQGVWYLRDSLTSTRAERTVSYGNPGDWPVPYVVSTSNDGLLAVSTHHWGLGIARGAYWFLSDSVATGTATNVFAY